MKKIVAIFMLAILYSCSCTCDEVTAADIAAQEEASTNDIEIIFTTTEPNYDEMLQKHTYLSTIQMVILYH